MILSSGTAEPDRLLSARCRQMDRRPPAGNRLRPDYHHRGRCCRRRCVYANFKCGWVGIRCLRQCHPLRRRLIGRGNRSAPHYRPQPSPDYCPPSSLVRAWSKSTWASPGLEWEQIPLAAPADTLHLKIAMGPVEDPAACSMGNPHATFFVSDLTRLPIETIGPVLERNKNFPERANIGFARIESPERIRLRVWGARFRPDPGVRLRRLCRLGERAPPWPGRPPRQPDPRWRRTHHHLGAMTGTC